MILARVLERTDLEPASAELDRPELRVITLAPRNGVQTILPRPPRP